MYDINFVVRGNLLINHVSYNTGSAASSINGVNNLLFDAGIFLKLLYTNKDAYRKVKFDHDMFRLTYRYIHDKKNENETFISYVDRVTTTAIKEYSDWFKDHFKSVLDRISKSSIDSETQIKFIKEMNRVLALLLQDTANIDIYDCLLFGYDIDSDSENVDTEIAYIKTKICDMLKKLENNLVKICLTDAEAIKLQQQNQSTTQQSVTNQQQVNNNNATQNNQTVDMSQQPFIYPFSMGPIVNNSEPINMAPFTVPISYTPSYNDPDIMKHFIITDCVKVNNKQEECDFEALLKRIALVMDAKDAELKLKNPSKFAFMYFINTKCWKMERVNKNNVPFNEGDNNYQCIYQNGTDKPQWFCRNKHAA